MRERDTKDKEIQRNDALPLLDGLSFSSLCFLSYLLDRWSEKGGKRSSNSGRFSSSAVGIIGIIWLRRTTGKRKKVTPPIEDVAAAWSEQETQVLLHGQPWTLTRSRGSTSNSTSFVLWMVERPHTIRPTGLQQRKTRCRDQQPDRLN
jgi:hypothetical protein